VIFTQKLCPVVWANKRRGYLFYSHVGSAGRGN